MKQGMMALAFGFVVLLASASWGQAVKVGDRPALAARTVDGGAISLEALRGRLVLLDFWASWCGPCIAAAPHMVDLNKKYGPKGMVIVGISLDQRKGDMLAAIERCGMAWPHIMDTQNIATGWGVNSIPRIFLINPDGQVVWTGHPSQVDAAIERAITQFPPRLIDPKTAKEIAAALDKADESLTNNDFAAACATVMKMPPVVKQDTDLGPRLTALQEKVDKHATSLAEDAEAAVEQKDYAKAADLLRQAARLTGHPAAAKAQTRMTALMAMPEARSAMAAAEKAAREAERAQKAEGLMENARKLQADEKHDRAYTAFKAITSQFAGTPAAESAAAEVKTYEADKAFMEKHGGQADEAKAKSLFGIAESYRAAGRLAPARERYQAVIDQFPDSSYAAKSRDAIRSMGAN